MIAGQRAVDLATERYNRGLTDFLNVVDAERQLYDLQEEYAAAQVAQGEQLCVSIKASGRVAELSNHSGHPAAATGHHCCISARAK